MSVIFPLSTADFFNLLPVKKVTFRLSRNVTFSENEAGERIPHGRGARLWQGEVQLDKDYHDDAAAVETLIALAEEASGSILLYDHRKWGPRFDAAGAVLGSSTPTISAVAEDMNSLSVSGLPAGYVLARGDYLGFPYGDNPQRHALHRVVNSLAAADASGVMADVVVQPKLRSGAQAGQPVTLVRPHCKAHLIEADYGTGTSLVSDGGVIQWKQTLR